MFTWEEAGQLRSMLQVIAALVILLIAAVVAFVLL
jgi:hypothetical protein